MKIGVVCYPTHGGSGVLATALGANMALRGNEVHFISYEQPFKLQYHPQIFYHKVNVPHYAVFPAPPYCLALANKIAEIIEQEQLNIIHAHYALPHSVSAYLALQISEPQDVKLITTLHGTDITLVGDDPSFYQLAKFALEKSDALTAVSDYLKNEIIQRFKITQQIHRIYNFVDVFEYKPLTQERLKGSNCFRKKGEKIIIHISNFRKIKRVEDVIEIFAIIQSQLESRLLLVGDGPEKSKIEKMVKDKGLQNQVHFLGAQSSVVELLSSSDLLLITSQMESFGLVNIEAMACGVCVVGSDCGGVGEVVVHGETGFLAAVGDVKKMAEYALLILKDDNLRKKMADQGRCRVINKFSVEKIIPEYEKLYQTVLNK